MAQRVGALGMILSLTVSPSGLAGQEPEPDPRVGGFIEAYYAPFSSTLGASGQLQLRNSLSGYAGVGHSIREDSAGSYADLGLSWDEDVFGIAGYLRGGVRIRRRFSGESMSDVTQVRGVIELGVRFGESWIRPFLSFRAVVFDPGPYGVDWSVGMAFPFGTGVPG
jgi:hypothetical protein